MLTDQLIAGAHNLNSDNVHYCAQQHDAMLKLRLLTMIGMGHFYWIRAGRNMHNYKFETTKLTHGQNTACEFL